MRIRTIKPEFWSHPVMSKQSDATKLLAVGLLNLADDEGYLYADPKMVRNALRPMDDDSRITTVSLRELSEIGYLSLRDHPTHGQIGRIESFCKHQVINKPKSSIIKELHEYGSNTVSIPDSSGLERNGMEGIGTEGNTPPNPPRGDGEAKSPKPRIPTSPEAKTIAELYGRRPTTAWSDKEVRALKAILPVDPEDLALVARYTKAEMAKGENGRHRRDLATFLNNFPGELDRARNRSPETNGSHQPAGKSFTSKDVWI
jgi:hypothetical protein